MRPFLTSAAFDSPISIKEIAYPIPSDAYFVSSTGSDSNPGTQRAPWRTLKKAVESAPDGATLVLRGGVYRNETIYFSKRLTIQPYPKEQVWLKGSIVVADWVADGSHWWKDNWTVRFSPDAEPSAIDTAYPLAGHPDQVFIDGVRLVQVSSRSQVGPGTFYVDTTANRIYIGDNPSGRLVEVSNLGLAMFINHGAEGSLIRGLGVVQYAPVYNPSVEQGMIRVLASRITFENNMFAQSAAAGVAVFGSDVVFRRNLFLHNGLVGIQGGSHRGLIEGNYFAFNNEKRFAPWWCGGGFKFAGAHDLIVKDNVAEQNYGTGFWCDVSCYNVTIVGNLSRDNTWIGITYEISGKAIIASNVLLRNGHAGLMIFGSNDVLAYNNTLSGNKFGIFVFDDKRVNTDSAEISMGMSWVTRNNTLVNNVVSDGERAGRPLLVVWDMDSNPIKNSDQMVKVVDSNTYFRSSKSALRGMVVWTKDGKGTEMSSLSQFQALGYEAKGFEILTSANPFLVDEANNNFSLKSDSPAIGKGQPLPAEVAHAIGVQAGVTVNMGALRWPGSSDSPSPTPAPTPFPIPEPTPAPTPSDMTVPEVED